MKKKIDMIIPITKTIQAISIATPAIPVNPKIAAITAITNNVIAQFIIFCTLFKFIEK